MYQSIRSENNEVPILLLVDYLCDIEKIGNTSVDRPGASYTPVVRKLINGILNMKQP